MKSKEWNVLVVPCPYCDTEDKHPMEERKQILVTCFKCGEPFHLDSTGKVRWDIKMEEV
jgi:Zn ribbon nucleic-acid-binding protein